MQRLDLRQGHNPLPFAPAQKITRRPSVGCSGVRIADIDGEEFEQAARTPCPARVISVGNPPPVV